jgi:hypothetical protein
MGLSKIKTKDQFDLTHDATQQNFIKKHTVDLENVQRNKKLKKERIYRTSSELKLDVKISPCQKPTACMRSAIFLHVKNQPPSAGWLKTMITDHPLKFESK